MIQARQDFGIEGYQVSKYDFRTQNLSRKYKNTIYNKKDIVSVIEEQSKKKSENVPAPNIYDVQELTRGSIDFIIYKRDRKTEQQEFVEKEQNNQIGPCLYDPKKLPDKIKGCQDLGSRLTIFEEC